MFFKFRSTGDKDFDAWVAKAKGEGKDLNQDAYLKLAEPTEAEPARYFKSYADGLYTKIIGSAPGRPDVVVRDDGDRRPRRPGRRRG